MIAVIVPARINSQRIKEKVLQRVGGPSLLKRACWKLRDIQAFGYRDVTTLVHMADPQACDAVPVGMGILDYPPELANESITGLLDFQFQSNAAYDAILTYNCTSPFIRFGTIRQAIEVLRGMIEREPSLSDYDSVCTVQLQQEFMIKADGSRLNFPRGKLIPSQELPMSWIITTGLIGCTREQFYSRWHQLGDSPYRIEVDRIEAIDINFPEDLEFAQIVAKGLNHV